MACVAYPDRAKRLRDLAGGDFVEALDRVGCDLFRCHVNRRGL